MSQPIVSVIIPCYNAASYLAECIESVLNQNYPSLEVILVDDGSTDDSVVIAGNYKEVKVLKQANSGACAARNLGLKHSQGKYIKFLDADDFLDSNCIEIQVAQAETLGDEFIVYGNFSILRGSSSKLVKTDIGPENQTAKLLFTDLLTSTPLHHVYMLKKIGGFDERFKSGQEWNLHVRLAANGYVFYHINHNIYFYRVHQSEDRISNQRKKYILSTFAHEIEKVTMTAKSVGVLKNDHLSGYFAKKYWWLGRKALREGLLEFAEKCFLLAQNISDDHKKNWPLYYRSLHAIFGVNLTDFFLKPIYKIFGNKYAK